jgi:hypothetical protein
MPSELGGCMRSTRRLTVSILALAALVAAAPLARPGQAAAQELPRTDEALEVPSTLPPPPAGVRDPFIPLVGPAVQTQQRPTLSGLRLSGLIWDSKATDQIRALVETTDGLGYILRLNDQKFGGKVVAIDPGRLRFSVVDEKAGEFRVRLVDLRLDTAEPTLVRMSGAP